MNRLITKGVLALAIAFSSQAFADFDCVSKDKTLGIDLIHLNVEFSLENEQPAVMVVYKDGVYYTHHGEVKHFAARAGNMHTYSFENPTAKGDYQFSLDDPKPTVHPPIKKTKLTDDLLSELIFPDQCGRAGCNPKFPPVKLKPNPYTSVFFTYLGKAYDLECFK